MKVLKTAVMVVGVVAAVASGVGAIVGAAAFAATTGVALATVAAIGTLASVASMALNFISPPKPKGGALSGSQTSFRLDPAAGIPYVIGRTAFGGSGVHRETWGKDNEYQGFSIVWSGGGPIQGIESFQASREPVAFAGTNATGKYAGYMWLQSQLGACPSPALASPVAGFPGIDGDFKLSGFAASNWVVKLDVKEGKKFAAGLPQPMAVLQGVKVYDPRQDSTYPGGSGPCRALQEDTYVGGAAAENPWLHALTWALGRWQNAKKVLGVGMALASINVPSFVEAANIADANGWKAGGVVSSVDDKFSVLEMLAQAGGGQCARLGAKLTAFVDAPRVSIATITTADLVGKGRVATSQMGRDKLNGVVPVIRSEANGWEQVPCAPVRFAEYVAEDGKRRTTETPMPLVQQADQAAELAAYQVLNSREFGPIDLPLAIRWMGLEPGDQVDFAIPELGLNGQRGVALVRGLDPGTGNVNISFRSETDGKHALALGKTTVVPPSPSLLPRDLSVVPAPLVGAWDLQSDSEVGANGEEVPLLALVGETDNLTADSVLVRYRRVTDPASGWSSGGNFDPAARRIEIKGVAPSTAYEVEVAYRVLGVVGEWRNLGTEATGVLTAGGFVDGGDLAYVDAVYFNSPQLLEALGGAPATLANFKTAQGTAAAIAGQGPGATAPGPAVLNNRVENGIASIPLPGGGTFVSPAFDAQGAIKIALPVGYSDSMLRFEVSIYDYSTGKSSTYTIGGYSYSALSAWIYNFAQFVGPRDASRPVYFGNDGPRACVWIGDPSASWSHVSVQVRNVQVSWAAVDIGTWDDGWIVSLDTGPRAQTDFVVPVPRAGDAVFNENMLEVAGGALATLPAFKTSQGTSAGFAGQGALATKSAAVWGSDVADRPAALTDLFAGSVRSSYVYDTGSSVLLRDRWPGEFGANVTESRVSAGFSGQGALATREAIRLGNPLGGAWGHVVDENNAFYINNANAVTALGTSAGFAGQGALATRSAIGDGYLEGALATRLAPHPLNASYLTAATMAYPNGAGLDGLQPAEAGANVTAAHISAGFSGQGALATRTAIRFGNPLGDTWGYIVDENNAFYINNANSVTALGSAASIAGQGPGATASAADVLNYRTENALVSVVAPGGAAFNWTGGEIIGTIRIVMPHAVSGAMVSFEVAIFDYLTMQSCNYLISGYAYTQGGGALVWVNCTAHYIGPENRAQPVTFGSVGGKHAIRIGSPGTAWQYPQILVRNFMAGYSPEPATTWKSGWVATVTSSLLDLESTTIAKPRAGDAVFGEGIKEVGSGAIATLPNFKTSQGTAAGFSGQTAWATFGASTGRVSRLGDGGRVLDPTIYNTQLLLGPSSTTNLSPTYTVGASNVTVNLPAHSRKVAGPSGPMTLSYGASSGVVAFSTYWVAYIDDPDLTGFSSPSVSFSSDPDVLLYPGRYHIASGVTPASDGAGGEAGGGGGGGGGFDNCVAADSWVEVADAADRMHVKIAERVWILARDVVAGDCVRCLVDGEDRVAWREVLRNSVVPAEGVRIVSASGVVIDVSATTPITQRDGSVLPVLEAEAGELAIDRDGAIVWERLRVRPIGPIEVAHLSCGEGTYLAGNRPGVGAFTHNNYYKP